MKKVIEQKDFKEVLEQFKGANAQIWLFDISHKRLALRLSLTNVNDVAYIVAIRCDHIVAPFSWKNADLSIITEIDKETMQPIFRVIDKEAGFQLISRWRRVFMYAGFGNSQNVP
jgi:hypothetical protein